MKSRLLGWKRRAIACIGIAALLFAQLAVPVHACPQQSGAGAVSALPCDMSDAGMAPLCHPHAARDVQAVDDQGITVPAPGAVASFVASISRVHAPGPVCAARFFLPRSPQPPLFLFLGHLRF